MRVGLASYGDIPTGLGTLAKWFWKNLSFSDSPLLIKRLIYPHRLGSSGGTKKDPRVTSSGSDSLAHWMNDIDCLVFIERPLPPSIVDVAHSLKKRVVCIVMPEWLPPTTPWLSKVDQFVVFTTQGYHHCCNIGVGNRTVLTHCPVDLEEFPFRLREKIETVTYCDGWGGVNERKGYPTIKEINRLFPDTVTIYSQRFSGHRSVLCSTGLYKDSDLILVPGKYDGVGLTTLEAMASGCIVLATNSEPYRQFLDGAYGEASYITLLEITGYRPMKVGTQSWPAAMVDPHQAKRTIDRWKMYEPSMVRTFSYQGRRYIEDNHTIRAWDQLGKAIIGEV